ncbi:3D domain-containing protein [Phosphitispora fastidiosa]|uniref:3D domain-containing protein n=1 Tax=Phosphitispora fastidiosa TaxID=2837202 RepID=UPI0022B09CBC|nr:3D domain-containing protein [Phosphitispora fastidiosa]MBU7007754.1 3D (Asp-Asp-Asp) domain-containing protein [Phosphitispora fastidiosa]
MYDIKNGAASLRINQSLTTFMAYVLYGVLVLVVGIFVSCTVKEVSVKIDNKTISYHTFAPTVQEVIREAGIKEEIGFSGSPDTLKEGETVEYYSVSRHLSSRVRDGMVIWVYKHRITKTTENEEIPAPVTKKWDLYLEPGQQRVTQAGKSGVMKHTFIEHYRDDELLSKEMTGSTVIMTPTPQVIAVGSYRAPTRDVPSRQVSSRQGAPGTGQSIKFVSTAYTHTGYRTATGIKPRRGVVAVDPRVIPMGTKLYIEGYGYGIASDTGGAIKGRKIDVFFETRAEALKWGRRTVAVQIIT